MALSRARVAARRTKDRWKSKTWFRITAPPAFNSQLIAETLSDEPQKLMQRTVEATLHELTGDMKQMHVKLIFQVKEVADNNAKTAFVGHTMTSDYVRRLTRRGNNKIPLVMDLKTKDGSRIRVKPFAVTDKRCQTTQNMGIRRAMARVLEEAAEKSNLSAFLADMLVGDLNNRMYKEARKVHPLRRIEIGKSEMLQAPTIRHSAFRVVLAGSLLFLVAAALLTSNRTTFLFFGGHSAVAICSGVLIVGCMFRQRTLLTGVLSHPVLVYIGKRSYALYIWHLAIGSWLRSLDDAPQVVLAFALSFLAAELSYRLVEAPALRLKSRLGKPQPEATRAAIAPIPEPNPGVAA